MIAMMPVTIHSRRRVLDGSEASFLGTCGMLRAFRDGR
jgi:hypothetical protein